MVASRHATKAARSPRRTGHPVKTSRGDRRGSADVSRITLPKGLNGRHQVESQFFPGPLWHRSLRREAISRQALLQAVMSIFSVSGSTRSRIWLAFAACLAHLSFPLCLSRVAAGLSMNRPRPPHPEAVSGVDTTANGTCGWCHHSLESTFDKINWDWMADHFHIYPAYLWELCRRHGPGRGSLTLPAASPSDCRAPR